VADVVVRDRLLDPESAADHRARGYLAGGCGCGRWVTCGRHREGATLTKFFRKPEGRSWAGRPARRPGAPALAPRPQKAAPITGCVGPTTWFPAPPAASWPRRSRTGPA